MAANGIAINEHRCNSDERHEQAMQDPVFAKAYNDLQEHVSEQTLNKSLPTCTTPIILPIVVHFQETNISDQCMIDATLAQIEQLNLDFAGCNTNAGRFCEWINAGCDVFGGTAGGDAQAVDGSCFQFCLADQNLPADGNLIPGGLAITTGYSTNNQNAPALWNGFLNVYVGNIGPLGFVPFLSGASNPNTSQGCSVLTSAFGSEAFAGCEGVDTDATFSNGATLTHEIGHWFGLEHTFSDAVADTPPQNTPNYGCPTVDLNNCTTTVGTDYGGNFMDYVDDDCMFLFTEDQIMIMQATVAAQAQWANNSISCMVEYPTCPQQGACLVACPAAVTTPYSDTEEICAISTPSYNLPTDFSSVVLDDDSDAVYIWSTGNYLSAGGTAAGATYTPAPPTCAPEEVTFYLNVDCGTTPLAPTLDAGTLVLTVYPDPASFVVIDLVTFTDGDCAVPTWVANPDCSDFVTVTPLDEPATVNTGDMGTVNYDVTLNYPVACCCPAEAATLTETNTATVVIPDNDPANPGCSTVTLPTGSTIADVIIDLGVTHTWVGDLVITVTSPAGTTLTMGDQIGVPATDFGCNNDDAIDLIVTFDDAAVLTAADFEAACPPAVDAYQPVDMLSAFDGEDAAGDWTVCITDNANGDTGSIISFGITVETFAPCTDPAGCTLAGTADYTCTATGVGYCDQICFTEYNANPGPDDFVDAMLCVTPVGCNVDASCEMAQTCDDGDPCTENDMETIASDNSICVPCAGTPVAQCTLPSVAQACDDGDPCTINDMEEVDACDATIVCVPCAGTPDPTSCDAACTSTVACDDGDPCTSGEQEVLAADGSVCTPCGLNAMPVTGTCNDPTATNFDPNATCVDNTMCTYGEYCDNICFAEYAANPGANDVANATLCVTPLGCADLATIDPSCITTGPCDDGDPCTENEMATVIIATGTTCTDCSNGTAVTPACGDPAAENYDAAATCIDNTLCTYVVCEDAIAGTITLADCDFTGTMVTVYDSNGAVVGTATVDAMGNYSLAGLFLCGSYTAELTAAPPCYVDEGGDLGPRQFSVNGDGTADGFNFAPIPANIPTVGEWGLIILGLMMSIVAIVGIRERKTNEIYS